MASLTALILVPLACLLLFSLSFISFACGLTLLIIKIANKKGHHPNAVYPVSIFLIANGIIITVSAIACITNFAGVIGNWLGGY